ncbi:MAG TPA: sigma-70 family RNA polymerase sigma factor [Ktedonobacteraceae bacterium]|nr:sigma-70 family RNA polymerase sigma factor [Ktedonobacteraceae bacterium]
MLSLKEIEDSDTIEVLRELPARSAMNSAINARLAAASEGAYQYYLSDISRYGLLSHDEEIDLARRAAAGSELARRRLVESNLRLVIAIARRYRHTGVPLIDLIQEGNLALMHAVEKFDYRRGCHFGTYATWWIRQAVSRAAGDQSRLIHLPEHVASRLRKLRRVAAQLSQESGMDPLPEQIAEVGQIPLDEVKQLLDLIEQPISLDIPLDEGARTSLADTIEDGTVPALAETASQNLLSEELYQAMDALTPREQVVISLRFGLGDGWNRTLLEIGRELGISRERVRQIEEAALNKIRQHYELRVSRK